MKKVNIASLVGMFIDHRVDCESALIGLSAKRRAMVLHRADMMLKHELERVGLADAIDWTNHGDDN